MKHTYVLITIDAEASRKFENGCWSYCVNGHFPDDLDEMFRAGAATPCEHGYRLVPEFREPFARIRQLNSDVPTRSSAIPAQTRIDRADAGLPLIFKSMGRFNMPAVVFLDATGMYSYGRPEFREAVDLVAASGHDLQFHIHPGLLGPSWFEERDIALPPGGRMYAEEWPIETALPVYRGVLSDFRTASPGIAAPIAHRAGAYRINDAIINTLVQLGFRIDSSLDLLNKKRHVMIRPEHSAGNRAFMYRGLIEVPITAYRFQHNQRIVRFSINKHASNRVMLTRMHEAGVRIITYILHSNSLMKEYGVDESSGSRLGRLGPDTKAIDIFESELALINDHPDMSVVSMPQLLDAIERDPSILEGLNDLPELDARAERRHARRTSRLASAVGWVRRRIGKAVR